tara:strand:- start:456 stop:632 length:177 start_codon:yes stop_codon:yes gene_type:complete
VKDFEEQRKLIDASHCENSEDNKHKMKEFKDTKYGREGYVTRLGRKCSECDRSYLYPY